MPRTKASTSRLGGEPSASTHPTAVRLADLLEQHQLDESTHWPSAVQFAYIPSKEDNETLQLINTGKKEFWKVDLAKIKGELQKRAQGHSYKETIKLKEETVVIANLKIKTGGDTRLSLYCTNGKGEVCRMNKTTPLLNLDDPNYYKIFDFILHRYGPGRRLNTMEAFRELVLENVDINFNLVGVAWFELNKDYIIRIFGKGLAPSVQLNDPPPQAAAVAVPPLENPTEFATPPTAQSKKPSPEATVAPPLEPLGNALLSPPGVAIVPPTPFLKKPQPAVPVPSPTPVARRGYGFAAAMPPDAYDVNDGETTPEGVDRGEYYKNKLKLVATTAKKDKELYEKYMESNEASQKNLLETNRNLFDSMRSLQSDHHDTVTSLKTMTDTQSSQMAIHGEVLRNHALERAGSQAQVVAMLESFKQEREKELQQRDKERQDAKELHEKELEFREKERQDTKELLATFASLSMQPQQQAVPPTPRPLQVNDTVRYEDDGLVYVIGSFTDSGRVRIYRSDSQKPKVVTVGKLTRVQTQSTQL